MKLNLLTEKENPVSSIALLLRVREDLDSLVRILLFVFLFVYELISLILTINTVRFFYYELSRDHKLCS